METTLAEVQDQDQPLFEALAAGDAGAMAELVERHARWVRGVAYSVLGNSHELDDVVQQIWMTVWRRADSMDDPSRWRYWLYRLAKNAALDAGRKRKRQKHFWQRFHEAFKAPAGEPLASRQIERNETHGRVLRAIEGLPAIYREPFILRHLEDWTYKQIGEAMDLPVDTVETRLVRARRLLREALGELDPMKASKQSKKRAKAKSSTGKDS